MAIEATSLSKSNVSDDKRDDEIQTAILGSALYVPVTIALIGVPNLIASAYYANSSSKKAYCFTKLASQENIEPNVKKTALILAKKNNIQTAIMTIAAVGWIFAIIGMSYGIDQHVNLTEDCWSNWSAYTGASIGTLGFLIYAGIEGYYYINHREAYDQEKALYQANREDTDPRIIKES